MTIPSTGSGTAPKTTAVADMRTVGAAFTRLERQLARQDLVLEITRLLTGETNLNYLWKLVAEKTCAALNADRTTMFLIDRRRNEIWTKVASALEVREIRQPLGVGLAGYVAVTGDVVNIADCYIDSRFNPEWDKQTGYSSRTMLVMPMRNRQGEIIGVFQLLNKVAEDGVASHRPDAAWPTFTGEDVELLRSIVASAAISVHNAQLMERTQELVDQTKEMFSSTLQVLSMTLDRRNPETAGHSQRVALTSEIMARKLDLSEQDVEKIRYAALLHDVGKIGVHDAVLDKPGKLTPDEYEEMKTHAQQSKEILEGVTFLEGYEDIPLIASQHHERLNGTGYPLGQHEQQITLGGRMLAVADVYDALRVQRVYKPSRTIEDSLAIMHAEVVRGNLDPHAVQLLERCLDEVERACAPLRPVSTDQSERNAPSDH